MVGDEALRLELLARMERDQAESETIARRDVLLSETARFGNTGRLRELLALHVWPGWKLVSVDGALAAWLIAQHSDHDLELQKLCLTRLSAAVAAGDADPAHWAYLVDRVAVAEGRKQVYGTQFDDRRAPQPIEDEEQVDERRKSVGLGTLADYRLRMWQKYGPPK